MSILAGKLSLNLHSVAGALAILLMLGNAIWAAYVFKNRDERAQINYAKYSMIVWFVWLIPFVSSVNYPMK